MEKKKGFDWKFVVVNIVAGVLLAWFVIARLPFLVIDLYGAYASADSPSDMIAVSLGVLLGVALLVWVYKLALYTMLVFENNQDEGEEVMPVTT